MPLKLGTTNIGAIYKGTTPISAIYKGTTLVFSSYSWQEWYNEYIYNALIPTTLNNKQVQDKAKLVEIQGNSCVVNQLNSNGDFHTLSGIGLPESDYGTFSVANNTLTFTLTQNISSGLTLYMATSSTLYANHKFLIFAKVKSIVGNNTIQLELYSGVGGYARDTISQGTEKIIYGIAEIPSNTSSSAIRFNGAHSSGNSIEVREYAIIDLTQQFPFDTPTTLTDNRVQAILNRGYIPYNTGTLKNVDMSEISSESFNIWDEEWESGKLTDGVLQPDLTQIRTKNYIKVVGGGTYYVEQPSTYSVYGRLFFYDKDYNYIGKLIGSNYANHAVTIPQNACYMKSYWDNPTYNNDICINVSSSLNGTYKPHITFTPLSLKYQGSGVNNSHDTFAITKTNYVFTRNVFDVDLGSSMFDWGASNSTGNAYAGGFTQAKAPVNDNTVANILSDYGVSMSYSASWETQKVVSLDTSHRLWVKLPDNPNVSGAVVRSLLTGYTLYYQLATPQVINIPRKHLKVLDLGSISWEIGGSGNYWVPVSYNLEDAKAPATVSNTPNIWCSRYMTSMPSSSVFYAKDKAITLSTSNWIYIRDSELPTDGTITATDFKNAMSGVYLFYETNAETTDFNDEIFIQSGGTVNGEWFSWKQNQLVDKARRSGNIITGITSTKIDNQTLSLTGNYSNSDGDNTWFDTSLTIPYVVGHKYLCIAKVLSGSVSSSSLDENTNFIAICPSIIERGNYVLRCFNNFGTKAQIVDLSNSMTTGNEYWRIRVRGNITLTNYTVRVNTIDLTIGFGSGNEPTSINDPRIQFIINNGYIPTDTNGTDTSITCEVLPNITLNLKCK